MGLNGAAYSLRSGFLTSPARKGASVLKMRDVSGHKSIDVLQSYVRDADLFPAQSPASVRLRTGVILNSHPFVQ